MIFDDTTPATLVFTEMRREVSKQWVLEEVAEAAGVTVADLVGPSRTQPLTLWRQIAMTRCVELGYSLTSVGNTFNRDHTTVMGARRKVLAMAEHLALHGVLPAHHAGGGSREYGLAETRAIAVTSQGMGILQ